MRRIAFAFLAASALVVPYWILWRIKLLHRKSAMGESSSIAREAALLALLLYALALASLTILPLRLDESQEFALNLVPTRSIQRCIAQTMGEPDDLVTYCTADLVGNILLFIPFGLLVPFVYTGLKSLWRVLAAAAGISAGIEMIQLVGTLMGAARSTDVDDVLLNVFGAGAGYLVFLFLRAVHLAFSGLRNQQERTS
jgi:glycopeptide antibiotics resistance protein